MIRALERIQAEEEKIDTAVCRGILGQ